MTRTAHALNLVPPLSETWCSNLTLLETRGLPARLTMGCFADLEAAIPAEALTCRTSAEKRSWQRCGPVHLHSERLNNIYDSTVGTMVPGGSKLPVRGGSRVTVPVCTVRTEVRDGGEPGL